MASSKPVSTRNAPHYRWGADCDGWNLLHTPGLSVIQEHMPAGTAEIRHAHHRTQQFFFVLSGTLTVEVGGAEYVVGLHEGLSVRTGEIHQVFNRSHAPAHFLVISQPGSHDGRRQLNAGSLDPHAHWLLEHPSVRCDSHRVRC
jgi:mannose-6-phosphate isomerase-like protein (cupin superfamily)